MQKNTLHERLRQERERLELNQTAFAEIGGVQKLSQVNYEKGARKPDSSYFERIAQAGADVLYILTGVRTPPAAQSGWGQPKASAGYELRDQQGTYTVGAGGPVNEPAGEQLSKDEKELVENYRAASEEGRNMLLASSKVIGQTSRKLVMEDPNRQSTRQTLPQTGRRAKTQG